MGGFGEHANPDYSGTGGKKPSEQIQYFIYCQTPNCGEKHFIAPGSFWPEGESRICVKCGKPTIYDAMKVMIKFPGKKPEKITRIDEEMRTMPTSGSKAPSKWPGYEELETILNRAIDQAAFGKGKDRHSKAPSGKTIPFKDQKIITLGKLIGPESHVYQASKKAIEGLGLRDKENGKERCVTEMLGAIVYLAAAVYVIENS